MQIEAEGEIATASTLARMLSNIPLARGGPASIVIFDIHALQVRFPCLVFATQLLCCCKAVGCMRLAQGMLVAGHVKGSCARHSLAKQ